MAEPSLPPNADVEEVLSAIRKLMVEGRTGVPALGRLVLTPALRVERPAAGEAAALRDVPPLPPLILTAADLPGPSDRREPPLVLGGAVAADGAPTTPLEALPPLVLGTRIDEDAWAPPPRLVQEANGDEAIPSGEAALPTQILGAVPGSAGETVVERSEPTDREGTEGSEQPLSPVAWVEPVALPDAVGVPSDGEADAWPDGG
jgi:hypothetical protein